MNVLSQDGANDGRRVHPITERQGSAEHWGDGAHSADGDSALARTLQTAWDHKWLLATCVLGFAVVAYLYASSLPRLYTATATVVLESQRGKQVVSFESVVPELSTDYESMQTELLFFKAPELIRRVAEDLNLVQYPEFNSYLAAPPEWKEATGYNDLMAAIGRAPPEKVPPTPEQALQTATDILQAKVRVSIMPGTYVFEISVTSEEPRRAAAIANAIVANYIERQREAKFDAMRDATGWLSNRVIELKEELERKEEQVNQFAADAGAVTEDALLVNTQRLKSMRERLEQQLAAVRQAREQLDELRAARAAGDLQAVGAVLASTGDRDERALALELAGKEAPAEGMARLDPLLDRVEQRLSISAQRAEAQADAVRPPLEELQSTVEAQSNDFVTLRQLRREAEATRLIYEYFLNRMKEISVQEGTQQADARSLAPAEPPKFASYPQIRASVMRAGVLGLVVGLGIVFLRDSLRTTVRSAEELDALTGLPVIGIIPDGADRRPGVLLSALVKNPTSGLAESVRNLRTAIQLSNFDAPPRVVMITSSVPDEGKSVTAIALAQTAAMAGRKVLLIDADLRRRRLKEYLNLESGPGIIALMSGKMALEEVLQRDPRTGLDMLLAERVRITPADLFESKRFHRALEELQEIYDLIVLDTPPVLAVPDARVIARQVDSVIYVVRWNSTTRRMVRTGLGLFQQVGINIAGVALTRVNPKNMDRYGYYGYGSGSRKMRQYYGT